MAPNLKMFLMKYFIGLPKNVFTECTDILLCRCTIRFNEHTVQYGRFTENRQYAYAGQETIIIKLEYMGLYKKHHDYTNNCDTIGPVNAPDQVHTLSVLKYFTALPEKKKVNSGRNSFTILFYNTLRIE